MCCFFDPSLTKSVWNTLLWPFHVWSQQESWDTYWYRLTAVSQASRVVLCDPSCDLSLRKKNFCVCLSIQHTHIKAIFSHEICVQCCCFFHLLPWNLRLRDFWQLWSHRLACLLSRKYAEFGASDLQFGLMTKQQKKTVHSTVYLLYTICSINCIGASDSRFLIRYRYRSSLSCYFIFTLIDNNR